MPNYSPNIKGVADKSMPVNLNAPEPNYTTNTWVYHKYAKRSTFYSNFLSAYLNTTAYAALRTFLLTTKPGSSYAWGDLDENGSFDLSDIFKVAYFLSANTSLTPIQYRNVSELLFYSVDNYAAMGLSSSWLEDKTGPEVNTLWNGNLYVQKIFVNKSTNAGSGDWDPQPLTGAIDGMAVVYGTQSPAYMYSDGIFAYFVDQGTGTYYFEVDTTKTATPNGSNSQIQVSGYWAEGQTTSGHYLMTPEIWSFTSSYGFTIKGRYSQSLSDYDFFRIWVHYTSNDKAGGTVNNMAGA